MSIENPGNFFLPHDFNFEEERDGLDCKPIKIYGKALYNKAIILLNLTQTICDLLPEDEFEEVTKGLMLHNALVIPAKIRAAMCVDSVYCSVMENAVIIKVNVCELQAQLWACNEIHGIDQQYTNVLKEEISNFRALFIQWVSAFDKNSDHPDEWHLFNDPNSFPAKDEED